MEERDGRQSAMEVIKKEKKVVSEVKLRKRAFQEKEEEAQSEASLRKKALMVEAEQK